jgi:transcriptional regulator GlxA family with amidase domain
MAHEIAILALNDVVVFDLGVAAQIFGAARDAEGRPLYRVRTCTPDGAPVRTSAGFRALPDDGPEILETAGTVVVAGVHGGLALTAGRLEDPVAAALARTGPGARLM